ncbi:baculoviral IAP repeat-containing protein 3 isoform X2 [Achroia grisella]|uniref:baculoviral IAP repeat-containing protein 3 isoform X2 n=1 Tax=Achroia grisella TaxID=688607 RepID=UPI0027D2055F|nr:baculoviral IAP repeat-containing protein 3 isoform X2 [Achroia grisella]
MFKFSESFCCPVNFNYVNKLMCMESSKMPILMDSRRNNVQNFPNLDLSVIYKSSPQSTSPPSPTLSSDSAISSSSSDSAISSSSSDSAVSSQSNDNDNRNKFNCSEQSNRSDNKQKESLYLLSLPTSPNTPSTDRIDNRDRFNFCTSVDMQKEEERLKSFVNWPVPFLSPEKLAQCGFYYKGRGDEVICAYCNVEIMSWREGDDPVLDHKRWSPQCPLLLKKSNTDTLYNLVQQPPCMGNLCSGSTSTSGRDECGTRALPTKQTPVHPQYQTYPARLRSFDDWPRSMPQKPEELADAGFYYTGTGDKTKCYFCDGGLKDWEKDDVPWEQHALWFSRCYFLNTVKGRDYVQRVLNAPQNNASQASAPSKPETETSPSKPEIETAPSKPEKISAATTNTTSNETEDSSKLCKVCYVDECNVVIIPCGHVCACAKCALSTDKCPICRVTIQSTVRLYFS